MRARPDLSFGELLRDRRMAVGLTQEALAERAGASDRTIRSLEHGGAKPHRDTARRLAAALGLEGADLAGFLATAAPSPRRRVAAGDGSAPPGTVPTPPTSLVGREGEAAAATALLLQENLRVLTLTGPGGIGKTRLALQVAHLLRERFADGVAFVPLAPVSDPSLVLPTIAGALGVREGGDQALRQALDVSLSGKRLLLLLDNFEHVAAAAPAVAALGAAHPGLRLLVTSRAALRLQGEQVYPVPPLPLPAPHHLPPLDVLDRVAAVRLFVERARAVKPDFALSSDNASQVAEICVHLDGLPLAIELAAARIALLPPPALLRRLQGGHGAHLLQILTDGARDSPERQRTLRATIAWSHDLLTGEEQIVFRRLAIFRGGWNLEAAGAVCTADRSLDALANMGSLASQNLLVVEEVDGEPRFAMLETIREFALERLETADESEVLRRRHADHFLALAVQADQGLWGPEQAAWLGRLDRELDNVRAALAWLRDSGDIEGCLRLGTALFMFWYVRGYRSEGCSWLEGALGRSSAGDRTATRAAALAAGALGMLVDDYPTARSRLEESVGIWRDLDDRRGLAFALTFLSLISGSQDDDAAARSLTEETLAIAREAGDRVFVALSVHGLAGAAIADGDLGTARSRYEESLRDFRELGAPSGLAMVLNSLGDFSRAQGDDAGAAAYYEESLEMASALGWTAQRATCLHNLGHLARRQGEDRRARESFGEALFLFLDVGDIRAVAECIAGLAGVGVASQPERSVRLAGAALGALEAVGGHLYASNQADLEASLATARDRLSSKTFAAAWAEGRSMTLEQALAFTLHGHQS